MSFLPLSLALSGSFLHNHGAEMGNEGFSLLSSHDCIARRGVGEPPRSKTDPDTGLPRNLPASGQRPLVEVSRLLLQVSNIVDPQQTVGLSTKEPGNVFTYSEFDGILGLAYPTLASEYSVPVFDNMMQKHLVAQDLFSVYLSR